MTTNVEVNALANLPHYDNQIVLRAKRDDFEVEILYDARYDGGRYWAYGFVTLSNGGTSVTFSGTGPSRNASPLPPSG